MGANFSVSRSYKGQTGGGGGPFYPPPILERDKNCQRIKNRNFSFNHQVRHTPQSQSIFNFYRNGIENSFPDLVLGNMCTKYFYSFCHQIKTFQGTECHIYPFQCSVYQHRLFHILLCQVLVRNPEKIFGTYGKYLRFQKLDLFILKKKQYHQHKLCNGTRHQKYSIL